MTRMIISELINTDGTIILLLSHTLVMFRSMYTKMMASTSIPISIRRLRVAAIAFM